MACCPKCGSEHIQLKALKTVNWGRAVAGWALFGIVGGAVGAITGKEREANYCLDCGTSWRAIDLYKTLETIKTLTGEKLDLRKEEDRYYMDDFVAELSKPLQQATEAEEAIKKALQEKENNKYKNASMGCLIGIIIFFTSCVAAIGAEAGGGTWAFVFASPVIGFLIGMGLDKIAQSATERELEQAKHQAERERRKIKKELEMHVKEFMNRYS